MNKEMLYRLKKAGEYQSKAIHALFPEKMGRHLDVIEKEMKMMVMEAYEQSTSQKLKVKKVDII